MNIIDLDSMFKKWRSYDKNSDLREKHHSKRELLNEISYDNYEKVKDWMHNASSSDYSFSHMFGGEWRRAFPLATKEQRIATEMMQTLQRLGWDPDFDEKQIEHTYTVNVGTQEEPEQEKRTRTETRYDLYVTKEANYIIPAGPRKGEEILKKTRKRLSQAVKEEMREDNISPDQGERFLYLIQKKLEYYTKHPDELLELPLRSIIVSRHPIDVLRMSDFPAIDSCHGEGQSHFHCAMAEAKGHGPVAYVVETEDLLNVDDLQADEIFVDPSRSIHGIKPIGRVRLRRYQNYQAGYDLAVPEIRTYGELPPGFLDVLRDWTLDQQTEYLEESDDEFEFKRDEDGNIEVLSSPEMHNFTRLGGSWKDTEAGWTFNKFFNTDDNYGPDDTDIDSSDEAEDVAAQYAEEAQNVQDMFDRSAQHAGIWHEVEWGDWDQPPYVSYGGSMMIEFNTSGWIEEWPDDWQERRNYLSDISELVQDLLDDVEDIDTETWEKPVDRRPPMERPLQFNLEGGMAMANYASYAVERVPYIRFEIRAGTESYDADAHTPRGFETFADWMETWDGHYEAVEEVIRAYLVQEGFIEKGDYDKLRQKIADEDLEFEWFETDIDGNDIDINSYYATTGKNYIVIDRVLLPTGVNAGSRFKSILQLGGGEHVPPSGGTGGASRTSIIYSDAFSEAFLKNLAQSDREIRRRMSRQMELPFPKLDPENPSQYEVPGTPRRLIKVPTASLFKVGLGMHWPHGPTPHDAPLAQWEIWLWLFISLDAGDSKEDLENAIELVHYIDNNMPTVKLAAKAALEPIWELGVEKEKEAFQASLKRVSKRVAELEAISINAMKLNVEDVIEAQRESIPDFATLPDDPDIALAETARQNIYHAAKELRDYLDGITPAGVNQRGPRTGMPSTWADINEDQLFGQYVASMASSIKRKLRRIGLLDAVLPDILDTGTEGVARNTPRVSLEAAMRPEGYEFIAAHDPTMLGEALEEQLFNVADLLKKIKV